LRVGITTVTSQVSSVTNPANPLPPSCRSSPRRRGLPHATRQPATRVRRAATPRPPSR
jgi:hypothetical protein